MAGALMGIISSKKGVPDPDLPGRSEAPGLALVERAKRSFIGGFAVLRPGFDALENRFDQQRAHPWVPVYESELGGAMHGELFIDQSPERPLAPVSLWLPISANRAQ